MQSWAVALIVLVISTGSRAPAYAQTFQPGEQFGSLSAGQTRQFFVPPAFVWLSDAFPEGVLLPPQDRGAALDISAGAMLNPRLAVVGGFDVLAGTGEVGAATFRLYLGVRTWLNSRFWLQGGLGPTYLGVFAGDGDDPARDGDWGLGAVGMLGVDLISGRNSSFVSQGHFAVHVEMRFATAAGGGVRSNAVAGLLGFTTGW